ncbi:MAG: PAS domain-containing protein [Thermoanaerobaculia bacterium]|nr:PAS domain-containing protein [Thermoanaerobaculia bacterium]
MAAPAPQDQPNIDFATLDLLPYGIIIVNREGTIVFYNSQEEEIAGRRREDVVGKNFFLDVAPCTHVAEFYGRFGETMQRDGLTAQFTFRFPFQPEARLVDITLTSFRDHDRPMCLIAVRDVSEQERIRERILLAERLREIGEVAATVAHNFNNVLMAVSAHASVIARDANLAGRSRTSAEQIRKAVNDATEIVARILRSTRGEGSATAHERLSVNSVVRDAVDFSRGYADEARSARGASIDIETNLPADSPFVTGIASEVREALVNLLRNSVDAIRGAGKIRVDVRRESGRVALEVADDGEGMPPEVQEKLFRPLFTTKGARGSGLGLASVYTIVRRHSGEISLRSQVGEGTRFVIVLPGVE